MSHICKSIITIFLFSFSFANSAINVIPHPYEYDINYSEQYIINENTGIVCKQKSLIPVAKVFSEIISRSTGIDMPIVKHSIHPIFIAIDKSIKNNEGYILNVNKECIEILGGSSSGVYYGLQTILQLLPPEIESCEIIDNKVWAVPELYIKDFPQFQYRGLHLDPCRHFLPLSFIRKQIDWMSKFKMNRLHLHLTDDQLWTIEIKKYPKLVEIGSKRYETDGTLYGGGFYTQDQLRDLVNYASVRGVTIIPEIEMPGHSMAALAAYPELGCSGGPYKVRSVWGIEENLFCAGNDSVFQFIEDVLSEVVDVFPSEYIHIGGDECPKNIWKKCNKCQNRIKAENLNSEIELHGYFMRRVEKILNKLGRKMIGWDEILDGGVSKTATVMSWRGEKGGIKAANQGNQVIMTPSNVCYFDHYQGSKLFEPLAQGGYSTPKSIYNWSPISKNINSDYYDKILGAQGNVWTEYIYSPSHAEYMIYPRIIALSETLWSHPAIKNYDDFSKRLDSVLFRLDYGKINYHIPLPEGIEAQYIEFIDSIVVNLKNDRNYKMYYSLGLNSEFTEYEKSVCLKNSTNFYTFTVSPTGRQSDTIKVVYKCLEDYHSPFNQPTTNGIYCQKSYGYFYNANLLDTVKFDDIELVDYFVYDLNSSFEEPWIEVYNGYINVDSTTKYMFTSDVEELWVDGEKIIDNNNLIKRCQRSQAIMCLAKGKHSFKLIYNNCVNLGFPAIWRKPEIYVKYLNETKFHVIRKNDLFR